LFTLRLPMTAPPFPVASVDSEKEGAVVASGRSPLVNKIARDVIFSESGRVCEGVNLTAECNKGCTVVGLYDTCARDPALAGTHNRCNAPSTSGAISAVVET
jgi:hypothetical protein